MKEIAIGLSATGAKNNARSRWRVFTALSRAMASVKPTAFTITTKQTASSSVCQRAPRAEGSAKISRKFWRPIQSGWVSPFQSVNA